MSYFHLFEKIFAVINNYMYLQGGVDEKVCEICKISKYYILI